MRPSGSSVSEIATWPPSTRSLPKRSAQRVEMADAVQQRQDRRARADRWCEGIHRAVEIEGLAAQQDEIVRAFQVFRRHGGRGRQGDVAELALHHQAGLASSAARRGRTRKVTSRPACSRRPRNSRRSHRRRQPEFSCARTIAKRLRRSRDNSSERGEEFCSLDRAHPCALDDHERAGSARSNERSAVLRAQSAGASVRSVMP